MQKDGKAGSVTASALVLINDPELVNDLSVLLVINKADQPSAGEDEKNPGKPWGAGLPTGGVEEWDDSPKHAGLRELKAETGLDGVFMSAYELGESAQRKYLFRDKDGKEARPPIPFFKDREIAPPHLRRGETLDTNDVLVFRVSVPNWRETPLRTFFLKERERLVENVIEEYGVTAEEAFAVLDRDGFLINFDQCDPADVAALGIEEINEICGVGIVPIIKVPDLIRQSPKDEQGRFIFYLGHLRRIQRVIVEMCREFMTEAPELVPERRPNKR